MAIFEYEKFIKLQALELCNYVEPLLRDPATIVPKDDLERMYSELGTYDQYHLVYALELGNARLPDLFIRAVPSFLSSQEGSVSCAVWNLLNRLPDRYITRELVDSARDARVFRPLRDFAKEVLARLESRLATD
jgi:hypothetical protein